MDGLWSMHNSPILEKQSGSSIQVAFNLINTFYSQLNSGEWVAAVLNHSDYKPKNHYKWSNEISTQVNQIHQMIGVLQATPGDLLFWGIPANPYHVGIYIGGNQFIAAKLGQETAKVQVLSKDWYPNFAGKTV